MIDMTIAIGTALIFTAIFISKLKVLKIDFSVLGSLLKHFMLALLGIALITTGCGIISNNGNTANEPVEAVAHGYETPLSESSSSPTQQVSLTGEWATEPESMVSFSLELTQEEGKITGSHIAVASGGDRIDAFIDDPSVFGIINQDGVGVVTFNSSYLGSGKATIRLEGGNQLIWTITESEGEHWLPMEAILFKVSD